MNFHNTILLRVRHTTDENSDEPLETVLVHRVQLLQIRHAEKENLGTLGDGYVKGAHGIDIGLSYFGWVHLRLQRETATRDQNECLKRTR